MLGLEFLYVPGTLFLLSSVLSLKSPNRGFGVKKIIDFEYFIDKIFDMLLYCSAVQTRGPSQYNC